MGLTEEAASEQILEGGKVVNYAHRWGKILLVQENHSLYNGPEVNTCHA